MRKITWGLYDYQKADFKAARITGYSTLHDGDASNSTGTGAVDENRITAHVGYGQSNKPICRIALDQIRGLIGQSPVIVYSTLHLWQIDNQTFTRAWAAFRFLDPDDTGQAFNWTDTEQDYRYRDNASSPAITWYGDAYSPAPGHDFVGVYVGAGDLPTGYFDNGSAVGSGTTNSDFTDTIDMTAELAHALAASIDLNFIIIPERDSDPSGIAWYWKDGTYPYKHPKLEVGFMYPFEFLREDTAENPDFSTIIDTDQSGSFVFNIGSVQRGETSSPIAGRFINLTSYTFGCVEVFDDHAEWLAPVKTVGSGDAEIDYVTLSSTPGTTVSQKYTVKITNAGTGAYEVKAEAYRDNVDSLNSTFGGSNWQGVAGSNWTAPEGGLTIPGVAWQTGYSINDEIVIYVTADSSLSTWPSDSADQIYITSDSSGPVTEDWRLINGRREFSTAAVEVSAATAKFPTRGGLVSAEWPADTPAFAYDQANDYFHEGLIASIDEADIDSTVVFSGTGTEDMSTGGNYNGATDHSASASPSTAYVVRIDGSETYEWSKDGGSTWEATDIAISAGTDVLLDNGIYITFASASGHVVGDTFTFDVTAWGVNLKGLTPASPAVTMASGSRVCTTLPFRNVGPAVWTSSTAEAASGTNRIYVSDVTDFSSSDEVYVGHPTDSASYETLTVDAVGSDYIDFTSNLDNTYPENSWLVRTDEGLQRLHLKCVAGAATDLEIKQARLNLRV